VEVHVAQLNVGTMIAPTDDPAVREFMANLDRINAQADGAPGFVWRLQTEEGNATSIQIFPDPLRLVNMSVWESVEQLEAYVYRTEHVEFLRRRAEWFRPDAKRVALWWIRAGTTPGLADGVRRIEFLARYGSSPYAFGFRRPAEPFVLEATTVDDPDAARLLADADRAGGDGSDDAARPDALVVGRLSGEAVACGTIRRVDPRTAAVTRLYVAPEARRGKLGAALLDRLQVEAATLGLDEIVLTPRPDQVVAAKLCERAGFARDERGGYRAGLTR
jgi:ribosomal protein S18 acetylase RimI-like enzyme